MDTLKKKGRLLPWALPHLKLGKRQSAEVAAKGTIRASEAFTPDAFKRGASPTVAYPAPAADGVGFGPAGKVVSSPPPLPVQVTAGPSPSIGTANAPAAGQGISVKEPDAAVPPVSEGAAPKDAKAGKDPDTDDLMSLFTEDQAVNDDLRRLLNGLEDVDVEEMSRQCRDIAARLKRCQRR